jgi:hypothetical protein
MRERQSPSTFAAFVEGFRSWKQEARSGKLEAGQYPVGIDQFDIYVISF